MSAAPGRSQAGSHRSAQHAGVPLGAANPGTRQALQARWQDMAPRERRLVLAAALLVAAALAWWLLLAPALTTLREAPARHAALDAQLERMQSLAAEARQLQADASTRPSQSEAQRALQAATAALGAAARVSLAGERATVGLQGASASAIGPWLAQVRANARSVPVQAHLTRSSAKPPAGPATAAAPPADTVGEARWDGAIVFTLPAR